MTTNEILIKLSVKHNGDWDKMYEDIKSKNINGLEDIDISGVRFNAITMLDKEYPQELKNTFKPPFVLYYKGDINLLKNTKIGITGLVNPYLNEITDNVSFVSQNYHDVDNSITITNVDIDNIMQPNENQLVITEYPNKRGDYYQTSRIVAGLSKKIIVSELASDKNPVVKIAVNFDKVILAIPQPFKTCYANDLIVQGAIPLVHLEQILED